MRRPLVIGNCKMNGSRETVAQLIEQLKDCAAKVAGADIAVCPPIVYLPLVAQTLQGSPLDCGAQNLSEHEAGLIQVK